MYGYQRALYHHQNLLLRGNRGRGQGQEHTQKGAAAPSPLVHPMFIEVKTTLLHFSSRRKQCGKNDPHFMGLTTLHTDALVCRHLYSSKNLHWYHEHPLDGGDDRRLTVTVKLTATRRRHSWWHQRLWAVESATALSTYLHFAPASCKQTAFDRTYRPSHCNIRSGFSL